MKTTVTEIPGPTRAIAALTLTPGAGKTFALSAALLEMAARPSGPGTK